MKHQVDAIAPGNTVAKVRTSPALESAEPLLAPTSIRISSNHGRNDYAQLLGLRQGGANSLHEQIKTGLSFSALDKLQGRLDRALIDLPRLVHIPERTLQRRKAEGRLQPDESDRLVRFARLLWKTMELFEGDLARAVQWLTTPATGLGGIRPLELAETEPGTQEVEALIGRLEYGVFA
jgi:putative toxin-antitoxin system antitoxin component (TIGR02293 family)